MNVKLLTEHHLESLSLKGPAQARLSLHLSKCHIVGNLMPRLKYKLVWVPGDSDGCYSMSHSIYGDSPKLEH